MYSIKLNTIGLNKYHLVVNLFFLTQRDSVPITSIFSACGIYEIYQNQLELVRTSDSYYDMIHSSREAFYFDGLYLLGWIPEEDRKTVMKMFEDADKGITGEGIYRRNCPNGETIWLHTKVKFLSQKEDRKIYFVIMNDISKYKNQME